MNAPRFLLPAALAASLSPSLAAAQPVAVDPAPPPQQIAAPPPRPTPMRETKRWYGWQILIGYAVSDAVFAGGVAASASNKDAGIPLLLFGGLMHMGAGPVVHLFHGGDRMLAIGTFSMHLLAPALGIAASRPLFGCGRDDSPTCKQRDLNSIYIGAAAGAFAAGVIDIAAFAYDTRREPGRAFWTVTPMGMGMGGTGLGVVGTF